MAGAIGTELLSAERMFTLITLLLGAVIALGSSLMTSWTSFKRQSAREETTVIKNEARNAQLGFVKLMQLLDAAANGRATIETQLERYSDKRFADVPISQKVRGFVGLSENIRPLEPSELAFLFRSSDPTLFVSAFRLERKVRALAWHAEDYQASREKLIDMMMPYSVSSMEGAVHLTNASIPKGAAVQIDKETSSLNLLVERLHSEFIEAEKDGRKIIEAFLTEARKVFANHFPDVSMVWDDYFKNEAN